MALTIGSVDRVFEILGRSKEQLDEAEVTMRLEEADRKIKARHFNKYMADVIYAGYIRASGTVCKVYDTYFPVKSDTTPEVYVNGVLATATADYNISGSVVTFSASYNLVSGDKITIYYIPEFFDDYANYMAAERLFSVSLLDTNNAVGKAVYDTIKETVRDYEIMAASKPHVSRTVDHREEYGYL
jgi:hypothetical protein